jgi:hypothetical protein
MALKFPISLVGKRAAAAGGTGFLLDDYTGASAAYSLRELTTATFNVGNVVIQARREAGTGVEEDTFTAAEVADGTFEAWTLENSRGGDAWVQRWYDQTGNANNAIQLTNTLQPQICSGGTLIAGGLDFDGTSHYFDCGFAAGSATGQSIFAVAQTSDLAANRILVGGRDANDDGAALFFLGGVNGFMRFSTDLNGAISGADVFTSALSANTEYLFSGFFGDGDNTIFLDGTQADTDPNAPATINTTTNYHIGRTAYSTAFWQGNIQEVIIYPDDQIANQAGIDGNIKTAYSIT